MDVSSAWLKRQIVPNVGLVSFRSIWEIIDFATPDFSASCPSVRSYDWRRRMIVLPSSGEKSAAVSFFVAMGLGFRLGHARYQEMKLTHPEIIWRGVTPVAASYGDIYYSPEDALGEVRHNFVSLVQPFFGQQETLLIGETGFGTGLNFLATWNDWKINKRPGDRLIFLSTEAHPLREADARKALKPFSELQPIQEELLINWPVGIPGPHRRFFDGGDVELWVLQGDAKQELQRQSFQADAWYFDGFNPSENPEIWSCEVLEECARLMRPGSVAGTFTVASSVRANLARAGLQFEKSPGFGRKRDCLKIWKPGKATDHVPCKKPPIKIVGDGIAGASLLWAAKARGLDAVQRGGHHPHRASGNPAALVNFKPTRAPNVPSNRLLSASLAHVQPIYKDLWLPGRGTLKPATSLEQKVEFQNCLSAMGWTDTALKWSSNDLGLFSPVAGYVSPRAVLEYLKAGAQSVPEDINFEVVIAKGFGTVEEAPTINSALRRNLGQVDVFGAEGSPNLRYPVTFGGYVTPQFGGQVLAGSTYDRYPDWDAPNLITPQESATQEIISKAASSGFNLPQTSLNSFVSARAFGRDHRPIVGNTPDGVYVLTGLGSRGFLTAPLLAEVLLDEIEGRNLTGLPSYDFAACVHPSRFSI